jgi:hypothetical protein
MAGRCGTRGASVRSVASLRRIVNVTRAASDRRKRKVVPNGVWDLVRLCGDLPAGFTANTRGLTEADRNRGAPPPPDGVPITPVRCRRRRECAVGSSGRAIGVRPDEAVVGVAVVLTVMVAPSALAGAAPHTSATAITAAECPGPRPRLFFVCATLTSVAQRTRPPAICHPWSATEVRPRRYGGAARGP